MTITPWRHWSVASKLIATTLLPAVLMFLGVIIWSYWSRSLEINQDLEERGKLIAAALAESSQYGVISGNLAYLDRVIDALLRVDRGIVTVDIVDERQKSLVKRVDRSSSAEGAQVFEYPIRREVVDFNTFSQTDEPHLSGPSQPLTGRSGGVIGYVRVSMSAASLLENKRQRILVGAAIVGSMLLLSAWLALYLSLGLTKPLAETIGVLRHIRGGNYAIDLPVTAGGEIGELQHTIVEMAGNLRDARSDLEEKIANRTHALQVAHDQVTKSNAEKRRLIRAVTSIAETERKTVAREIHDHLNAALIVVRLESERILDLLGQDYSEAVRGEIRARATAISDLTKTLYTIARNIVKRLRPEVLDTLGLQGAVEEMVHNYDAIHPDCTFVFRADGDLAHLDAELTIDVYRLIQEALSNVVKHAKATRSCVSLQVLTDDAALRIVVSDNGVGFDPGKALQPGVGLVGMRERVAAVFGSMEILPRTGGGTKLVINLPLHRPVGAEPTDSP